MVSTNFYNLQGESRNGMVRRVKGEEEPQLKPKNSNIKEYMTKVRVK